MRPQRLDEALAAVLTPEEHEALVKSYDVVGSIAIIHVPPALVAKESAIAAVILSTHKHIKTVLKRAEKHDGEFRTQALRYVSGEDTRETLVVESGCKMLVNVETVYFSVRLSTERLRLARMIQPAEHVLVLFSGAAPYVVIFAKHSLAEKIVGVEKNPVGHTYGVENLRLNKIKHAVLYNADCNDLSFLRETFDRIIMPAPLNAIDFLTQALSVAKDTSHIHCYCFGQEHELPLLLDTIKARCHDASFVASVLSAVKAGQHAPYTFRWCIDCTVVRTNIAAR